MKWIVFLLILLLLVPQFVVADNETINETINATNFADKLENVDWNKYIGGTIGFITFVATWGGGLITSLLPNSPPVVGLIIVAMIFLILFAGFANSIAKIIQKTRKWLVLVLVVVLFAWIAYSFLAYL